MTLLKFKKFYDRSEALQQYYPHAVAIQFVHTHEEIIAWLLKNYGPSASRSFYELDTEREWVGDSGCVWFADSNKAFEFKMRWG